MVVNVTQMWPNHSLDITVICPTLVSLSQLRGIPSLWLVWAHQAIWDPGLCLAPPSGVSRLNIDKPVPPPPTWGQHFVMWRHTSWQGRPRLTCQSYSENVLLCWTSQAHLQHFCIFLSIGLKLELWREWLRVGRSSQQAAAVGVSVLTKLRQK